MDVFVAVIVGAWSDYKHKIVEDYGGRSEDISGQAQNYTVTPDPNFGEFRYWHSDLTVLDAIKADTNYLVMTSEAITRGPHGIA